MQDGGNVRQMNLYRCRPFMPVADVSFRRHCYWNSCNTAVALPISKVYGNQLQIHTKNARGNRSPVLSEVPGFGSILSLQTWMLQKKELSRLLPLKRNHFQSRCPLNRLTPSLTLQQVRPTCLLLSHFGPKWCGSAKLQNTRPLISMPLNKNSVYFVIPHSTKGPNTCK